MQAEIVLVNRQKASDYLKNNVNNRPLNKGLVARYVYLMSRGLWKENGESIIIDTNGTIKDGQHRLSAIAEGNFEYHIPIITGVDPSVMSTIDTGRKRSLYDVFHMEGVKNAHQLAATVRRTLGWDNRKLTPTLDRSTFTTPHIACLNHFKKNEDYYKVLNAKSVKLVTQQDVRLFSITDVAFLRHIIEPYNFKSTSCYQFIEQCMGINMPPKSAAYHLRKILAANKKNFAKITIRQKVGLYITAWNLYNSGNAEIDGLGYKATDDIPEVSKPRY